MASSRLFTILCMSLLATSSLAAQSGRKLFLNDRATRIGRHLLDMDLTPLVADTEDIRMHVFNEVPGPFKADSEGNCLVTGFPGSPGDSGVAGPFTIGVPVGGKKHVEFTQAAGVRKRYDIPVITGDNLIVSDGGVQYKPTEAGQTASSVTTYIDIDANAPICTITLNFYAM